jgi:hypothetical protein
MLFSGAKTASGMANSPTDAMIVAGFPMGYEDIAPIPVMVTEAGGRVLDLAGHDVLSGDGSAVADEDGGAGGVPARRKAASSPLIFNIALTAPEARDLCRWLQLADKPARMRAEHRTVPGEAPGLDKVRAIDGGALREGMAELLRVSPGGRDRADREPVPAGPAGAGARASQPSGPVPATEVRPVPAESPQDGFPADPRQRVQRAVRRARVEPGPGAGRVLGLDRRAGIGAPGRHAVGRRPRPAAHHGDPQGVAGDPGAPGVAGRVRVAAALPAGGPRPGPGQGGRPAVADAAAAVPAAGLQRGPDDVRPGERRGRFRVVTALPAVHGSLPARP